MIAEIAERDGNTLVVLLAECTHPGCVSCVSAAYDRVPPTPDMPGGFWHLLRSEGWCIDPLLCPAHWTRTQPQPP